MNAGWIAFYEDTGPQAGRILSVYAGNPASIASAIARRGKPHVAVPDDLVSDPANPVHRLPSSHYVAAGVITACATAGPTWDPASQTLSGLPTVCTIRIDGSPYDVSDGEAVFGTLVSGTYQIDVVAAGYLPLTLTVTV